MTIFGAMEDPRRTTKGNFMYPLGEILFLVISAVVSDCDDWEEIIEFGEEHLPWLRKYYPYRYGIPSHDTLERVFAALDPKTFGDCFASWSQSLCESSALGLVAVDGKTIRGSQDKANGQSALHIVSAYAQANGVCLGQVATEKKSNEITAIPELLGLLSLKGATVTIDAMGCQKKIVEKILDKQAGYLITVKKNQKSLYEEVEALFSNTLPSSRHTERSLGHGRGEKRVCTVIDNLKFLDESQHWQGIQSVVRIESERWQHNKETPSKQARYYITSHRQNAEQMSKMVRGHWSIENQLHWGLDVVFKEDEARRRKGNAPANFNIVLKVALTLVNDIKEKRKSKKTKRKKAGWSHEFREKVLKL